VSRRDIATFGNVTLYGLPTTNDGTDFVTVNAVGGSR
jgi:hypothetical protein